ncbi:MAG: TlpA family protein disulfide reductase [Gemmatimonadota bacterium]|nr:MAG: TlpA family protein disulfide reductase [Gemmatimonadota bacterium]
MRIQKFEPRRDPPEITIKSLDGKKVALEDFRGKVVFLNFWATWCGWCKREMPSMEKLYEAFKDRGLEILAVDVRESREKIEPFWDKYGLTFPAFLDKNGMASYAFGVRGMPATFLIDRQGKVVGSVPGYRDWFTEDAKAVISQLLSEKGPKVKEGVEDQETSDVKEAESVEVTDDDAKAENPVPFNLNSISGPPVLSQGQIVVKNAQVFDLDKGMAGDEKSADFSWSELGLTTRFLIPQNGAEFSNKGVVDQVTFDDIILTEYSGSPINGSEGEKNRLKVGTVLYARTNEGRFACLRIDNNSRDLELSWITYKKD